MAVKFSNNFATTLAGSITSTATTLPLTTVSGLPTLGVGDYTYLTLETGGLAPTIEIVKVTAINSGANEVTVVRAQDGTTASSFSSGDKVELRVSAILLNDLSDEASVTDWGDILNKPSLLLTNGDGSDLTDVRAETVEVTVKNVSGGSLAKGTPVHQTGTSGASTFEVVAADASNASVMPAHFVLLETLADQAEGRGLLMGRISGVDTSSFSEGDTIYVAVGGGYTNSAPTGEGNLIQNLGTVTRVDSTNGGGEVMGAGRSNATPNLNEGNIFLGNASNQAATASLSTSVSSLSHYNNTNWDTAYGWGDHASAGYQAASTALTTSTTFGGDVSGTYNAIVVANDSHTHDSRYYTESEADTRFVNVTGDTMTGTLTVPEIKGGGGEVAFSRSAITTTTSTGETRLFSWSGDEGFVEFTLTNAGFYWHITANATDGILTVDSNYDGSSLQFDAVAVKYVSSEDRTYVVIVVYENTTWNYVIHSRTSKNVGSSLTNYTSTGSVGGVYISYSTAYIPSGTAYAHRTNESARFETLSVGSISGGSILKSGANISVANITATGYLRGPATFTIDPSAHGNNTGTVVIAGNLQVDGTTTTINSTTLTVDDKNIVLNYGAGDTSGSANGAGITIQDAVNASTDATILWDATNDEFDFSHPVNVSGASSFGTLTITGSNSDEDALKITNGRAQLGHHTSGAGLWLDTAANAQYWFAGLSGNDFRLYRGGNKFTITDAGNVSIVGSITASGGNSSQWNTAYGWGNHASAGYENATEQTATNINNSGTDMTGLDDGWYKWGSTPPTDAPFNYAVMLQLADTNQKNQLAFGGSGSGKLAVRRADSGTFYDWANFWNEDNDGSGSGLDADLLDGVQGSSYLRLDQNNTLTGRLTFAESGYSIANDLHVWKRSYAVWANNPKELLYHDGNSLPNGGAYRFHAHIAGTGTDQSATAVYWNENGTWKVNVTYQSGTSSNHPEFIIGSNGKPHISTDHPSTYTIEVLGERLELGEGTGTDNKSGFGADAYMSEVQGALRHNPSGGSDYTSGDRVFTDGYHPNADAWTTSRTITLAGDLSGSVTLDGSSNVTLTGAVYNDSHIHTYSTLSFSAGNNVGTSFSASNFWISPHTTGQSDVPTSYVDIINLSAASTHGIQLASRYSATSGDVWIRTRSDNNSAPNGPGLQPWNYLWHSNNDGSGSGLDADLLDGVQGSSFLRSDANDTATGLITFSNASDAQITLDGQGTTWAGIKWQDVNGYDYTWYNGQNSTFAIGGGGSNVAGKKLHVHGGLSVGSGVASQATPTNGIYSEGEISVAGSTVYHTSNDGSLAKVVKGTVTGVNNSTYVTAFTVNGNSLASAVRCSFHGTSNAVVVNAVVDLQVNHSKDILISSSSGFYTKLTIKVVTNDNEDFAVEVKHNGNTSTDLNVEVFPLNSEIVTFATSHSYTGVSLEHLCDFGFCFSGDGGSNANIKTDGTITSSGLTSTGLATLSGGLSMSNTNIAFVNALSFADPGPGEGITWSGGNWSIWESPDDLTTNTGGNLQFVTSNSNRRMTVDTSGKLWTSHQGFVWGASNDGSGSGLDADLLDGNHASAFLGASATASEAYYLDIKDTRSAQLAPSDVPERQVSAEFTNQIVSGWHSVLNLKGWHDNYATWQLIGGSDTTAHNNLYFRSGVGSTWSSTHTVWHSGVDGSGSGLDADLLDGLHETGFVRTSTGTSSNLDSEYRAGMVAWSPATTGGTTPGSNYGQLINIVSAGASHNNSNNWITQLGFGTDENSAYFRSKTNAGSWNSWRTFWHTGNDGSGSGLDADLLDGQQGSYYASASSLSAYVAKAGDTMTGSLGVGIAPSFRLHAYHPTTNVVARFESGDSNIWIDLHDSDSGSYGALLGHDSGALFKVADQGVTVRMSLDNNGLLDTNAGYSVAGTTRINSVGDGLFTSLYIGSTNIVDTSRNLTNLGTISSGAITSSGKIVSGGLISADNRAALAVAHWSNSSSSTGAVIIELPGTTSNYSMMVIEITTYEYNSNGSTTYTISGHNWSNTANAWYNNNCYVSGIDNKGISLGRDSSSNRHIIQIGGASTAWNYGAVTVTVKNHPSYYDSAQDIGGSWNIYQTTNLSTINATSANTYRIWNAGIDGSGSGLDADVLDGLQATSFLRSDASDSVNGNLLFNTPIRRGYHNSGHLEGSYNNVGANGSKTNPIYTIGSGYNPAETALADMYGIGFARRDQTGYLGSFTGTGWGMYVASDGDARIWLDSSNGVIQSTGQHYAAGSVVWNAGNDGSGSGLDADTLDGLQASQFLRSDANDSTSGALTVSGNFAANRFIARDLTGSGIANSYDERVVLLIPIIETNSAYSNLINGKLSALKTGGNVCDVFDVFAHSVWNDTRASFFSQGQRTSHKFVSCTYDGIKWLAIKFDYTANPYNYFTFHGAANTNVSGASDHILKVISYYDNLSSTVLNSEINNSIADYTPNGTAFKGAANSYRFDDNVGTTNYMLLGNTEFSYKGNTIWHAGNDGSGSSLDADTLDGVQGSSYLRSDADDTHTHTLTFSRSSSTAFMSFPSGATLSSVNASGGDLVLRNLGQLRLTDANDWDWNAWAGIKYDKGASTLYIGGPAGSAFNANSSPPNIDINFVGLNGSGLKKDGNVVWHAGNDGSGSGLDADTLDGIQGSAFLRSNANDTLSAQITFNGNMVGGGDGNRHRGVFGNYNSYRIQHMWSMGTAYVVDSNGADFGNLYGFAYTYDNRVYTSNAMAGDHQIVWCINGTPKAALGANIWTAGNVTAYSDRAVKTNLEVIPAALDKVCQINGYTYDRTDFKPDPETGAMPETRQAGVVAQEVEKVLPEVVSGVEGGKSVAYGNMVALLIEAIKELKAEVDDLKAQLEEVK